MDSDSSEALKKKLRRSEKEKTTSSRRMLHPVELRLMESLRCQPSFPHEIIQNLPSSFLLKAPIQYYPIHPSFKQFSSQNTFLQMEDDGIDISGPLKSFRKSWYFHSITAWFTRAPAPPKWLPFVERSRNGCTGPLSN